MKTTNKSTIGKFWDWIKGLFGIKAEEVATAVSNAKDEVKETKRNVETKVEDVFADLKETYAEAKEVTEEVVEEVKEVFEEAKDAVEEVIEDAVEKVTGSDKEVV